MNNDAEVQRALGRIEGTLLSIQSEIRQHFEDDKGAFTELSRRLGTIEKKTWAAGGIISLVVAYFTTKLSGH